MATARNDLTDHSVQGPPAPLLTVRDVAARLQVSTKTVYRLKAEGLLAFVKVRGSLRFRDDDVCGVESRSHVIAPRYGGSEQAVPPRLNLQFEVTRRGRGARRR